MQRPFAPTASRIRPSPATMLGLPTRLRGWSGRASATPAGATLRCFVAFPREGPAVDTPMPASAIVPPAAGKPFAPWQVRAGNVAFADRGTALAEGRILFMRPKTERPCTDGPARQPTPSTAIDEVTHAIS